MFKLIFLNKVTPLYQDNNNQKEEEECLICLSTINNKKILVLENCCHKFCYDCIDKWIDVNPICPLCRSEQLNTQIVLKYQRERKLSYKFKKYINKVSNCVSKR